MEGFFAKLSNSRLRFAQGDVAASGEATNAWIPVVPRMGLRLSYLRCGSSTTCKFSDVLSNALGLYN
jgi:hypothetical protein